MTILFFYSQYDSNAIFAFLYFSGVRIWSKSGKLVATCAIPNNAKTIKNKGSNWPTLLWYRPNSLLVVDGKSQLLEMNPLQIDW